MYQPSHEQHRRVKRIVEGAGYKIGGALTAKEDHESDVKLIKAGIAQHETQEHGGKHSRIRLRRGGMADGGMSGNRLDQPGRKGKHSGAQVNVVVMPHPGDGSAGAGAAGGLGSPMAAPPPRPPMVVRPPPGAGGPPPGAGMPPPRPPMVAGPPPGGGGLPPGVIPVGGAGGAPIAVPQRPMPVAVKTGGRPGRARRDVGGTTTATPGASGTSTYGSTSSGSTGTGAAGSSTLGGSGPTIQLTPQQIAQMKTSAVTPGTGSYERGGRAHRARGGDVGRGGEGAHFKGGAGSGLGREEKRDRED